MEKIYVMNIKIQGLLGFWFERCSFLHFNTELILNQVLIHIEEIVQ